MSIQALMALLGHNSPAMTLRYATLASPTLRTAYDQAMGKIRPRLPIAPTGRPIVPDRVDWLSSEMLKTRVAHGYCSRDLVAEACPYANICEGCSNYVTAPEFTPALQDQLADVQALHADAQNRGWASEAARHAGVITSLKSHLQRTRPAASASVVPRLPTALTFRDIPRTAHRVAPRLRCRSRPPRRTTARRVTSFLRRCSNVAESACRYHDDEPPSTFSNAPVMPPPASLHKSSASAATSSTLIRRLIIVSSAYAWRNCP